MTHPIDELLRRIYGVSDDDILREIEAAEAEVLAEGGPDPDPEGFERLWNKIIEEHGKGGARG